MRRCYSLRGPWINGRSGPRYPQATGQNWADLGPVAFWPGLVTGITWRSHYWPKFSSRYLAVTSPLELSPCRVKVRVTGNLPKNGYGPVAGEWFGYSALKSKPAKGHGPVSCRFCFFLRPRLKSKLAKGHGPVTCRFGFFSFFPDGGSGANKECWKRGVCVAG